MSDKSLMDAIEDLLTESIADDINKITADNVKDGANLKPMGDKSSPDTQGVLGSTSGAALDAGGDKDVGPSGKKGHFPSQASSDTQGVLGSTSGAALDAGGDKDVGGSKGDNASDASADTQGVEGKTSGAALDAGGDKDVGKLKEDEDFTGYVDAETGEPLTEEEVEAILANGGEIVEENDEELEEASEKDAAKARALRKADDEAQPASKVSLSKAPWQKEEVVAEAEQPESVGGKGYEDANKKYRPEQEKNVNPENKGGNPMGSTSGAALDAGGDKDAAPAGKKGQYPSEASSDTQGVLGSTKGAALDAGGDKDVGKLKEEDELEEKLHGDQDKLDHNKNNKIDAQDMKMVRKIGPVKEEDESEIDEDELEEGIDIDSFMEMFEISEESIEELEEMDLEKMKADYLAKGGKITKGKTVKAKGSDQGYNQGAVKGGKAGGARGSVTGGVDAKGAYNTVNKRTPDRKYEETEVDEDEALTEDFKERAEVIFEAAVGKKVSMIREELEAEFATKLEEETAALNEKVAEYVEEAVAEWLQENALEVRYSLRTEIAEGFMKGLKNLFQESYIEIPEEDASVVDELTEAVEEQRDTIISLEEELKDAKKFILEVRRKDVLKSLTEDLTATQAVRLEGLSENIEASDVEEFKHKVEKLKEGYFDPSNEKSFVTSLTEEVLTGEEFVAEDDQTSVAQYAKFLSKTILK